MLYLNFVFFFANNFKFFIDEKQNFNNFEHFKKKMFVLNQRNFIFNINDFNIKQQRRSILLKNDKIKINKLNEYYNNQKILND